MIFRLAPQEILGVSSPKYDKFTHFRGGRAIPGTVGIVLGTVGIVLGTVGIVLGTVGFKIPKIAPKSTQYSNL